MNEPFRLAVLVLPGSSMMTVASVLDPWRALNRVAGEALAPDLRAELDLLRAELDLLKSAFRRHCREAG